MKYYSTILLLTSAVAQRQQQPQQPLRALNNVDALQQSMSLSNLEAIEETSKKDPKSSKSRKCRVMTQDHECKPEALAGVWHHMSQGVSTIYLYAPLLSILACAHMILWVLIILILVYINIVEFHEHWRWRRIAWVDCNLPQNCLFQWCNWATLSHVGWRIVPGRRCRRTGPP